MRFSSAETVSIESFQFELDQEIEFRAAQCAPFDRSIKKVAKLGIALKGFSGLSSQIVAGVV